MSMILLEYDEYDTPRVRNYDVATTMMTSDVTPVLPPHSSARSRAHTRTCTHSTPDRPPTFIRTHAWARTRATHVPTIAHARTQTRGAHTRLPCSRARPRRPSHAALRDSDALPRPDLEPRAGAPRACHDGLGCAGDVAPRMTRIIRLTRIIRPSRMTRIIRHADRDGKRPNHPRGCDEPE